MIPFEHRKDCDIKVTLQSTCSCDAFTRDTSANSPTEIIRACNWHLFDIPNDSYISIDSAKKDSGAEFIIQQLKRAGYIITKE